MSAASKHRVAARRLLGLALLAAVVGCSAGGDTLLIEITHPSGRDPANWAGELQVSVVDARMQVVDNGSVPAGDSLRAARGVLDDLSLEVGEAYFVVVNALLTDDHPCEPGDRAVGVSPPFVYEEPPPKLSVYLDCADQASSAALLESSRLYHTATFLPEPLPHGRVVVVGGAELTSLSDLTDLSRAILHDSAEVFDPALNGFSSLQTRLTRPRAFHAAAVNPRGELIVTGGLDHNNVGGILRLEAVDLVERLEGDRFNELAPLASARALHAALALESGQLLVAAGVTAGYVPVKTAELYDPVEGERDGEVPKMSSVHVSPGAVAIGDLALLIGGLWWPNLAVKEDVFCRDGRCGECAGPCFEALSGFPKNEGRSNLGVAHVPCSDGTPGAVYAVGGHHDEHEATSQPAATFDDIYCVELDNLQAGLRRVGGLLGPRYGHSVTVVRGPDDSQRLLVAGGSDDEEQLLKDAELVPVGCRCERVDRDAIVKVTLKNERVGHTATRLADGSVLLVGGLVGSNTAERFTPTF